MEKKKINNTSDDFWIYILLQTALIIFMESIKSFNFKIFGIEVIYAIFLVPFTFLITNLLLKKYGYKYALIEVFISSISLIIFMFFMSFSLGKVFVIYDMLGDVIAYIVSQIVNILFYKVITCNVKSKYLFLFINYIFSIVFFYMAYTLANLNSISLVDYWSRYVIGIGIQIIICIFIIIIQKIKKK